jgi:hypothetical protein
LCDVLAKPGLRPRRDSKAERSTTRTLFMTTLHDVRP